ncbi:MAG: ABC transporter substrate-binding protein [Micropruina sp.]|nr:ABC transporter substrate-binding protein [Micropruina sp.]
MLVGVVSLLVGSGCVGGPQGGDVPTLKRLVVAATAEPPSMDPTSNPAAAGPQVMLYNVYETLVKLDSEGHLRPLLAQEWNVSPDRRTYTFSLNPAAKFASGGAVTAEAVVASIRRIQTDNVSSVLTTQMSVVQEAMATNSGTVTVTLNRPSNNWLYDMSSTAGMVFDPAGMTAIAEKTAGSGPFRLKSWSRGQNVILEKNPNYWGTPARFDEVTFRYFADPNAMNAAMLAGDIDVISNLQAPDALAQFADPARFQVINGTTNGEVVLGLNHNSKVLKSLKVRQAITRAIDRQALIDTVWNGEGTLIGSMAVPTDPWYEDLTAINAFDPTKAKELLKQADVGSPTLRLRVPTLPYAVKSAQFVASQLKDAGFKVVIDELEFPSRWLDVVYTKSDYDLTIVAHVEPRDIGKFADKSYYWHYDNPTFVAQIAAADRASEAESVTLTQAAARTLAEDAAAVWLFCLPNLQVSRVGITGIGLNATTLSFDLTTIASK